MHWAASHGDEDTVRLLIGARADINAKDKDLFSPLHVAAAIGNLGAVAALIEGGASLTETNLAGNTPVHLATLNGHVDILQVGGNM